MKPETKLQTILESGNKASCMAFFKGMAESDRRNLAPMCLNWLKQLSKNDIIEKEPGVYSLNQLLPAAQVAIFSTGTFSELKKLPFHLSPGTEDIFEILTDRKPKWIDNWVLLQLEGGNFWGSWQLIRKLILDGLAKKPDHPNYYLGMINGVVPWHSKKESIEDCLLKDPGLLDHEIWKLFEYEGSGETSLANRDRFGKNTKGWSDAFLSLAHKGKLSRERLLNCSLNALQSDFNHYRAKWFFSFYDALNPGPKEHQKHAGAYLHMLSMSAPNVVSWAFKKVEAQYKAGSYKAEDLIPCIQPVLESRTKGIVKRALKLLLRVAKQWPDKKEDIAMTATTALSHEATDVQEAAIHAVNATGTKSNIQLVDTLATYADMISPSLRHLLNDWLENSERVIPVSDQSIDEKEIENADPGLKKLYSIPSLLEQYQGNHSVIHAAVFDGTDLPRLAMSEEIKPVQDLEELIDICAQVIEDNASPDDIERAIDGISRLCDRQSEDFHILAGAIIKRAKQRISKDGIPFTGTSPGADLCGLILVWASGSPPEIRLEAGKHYEFIITTIDGEQYKAFDGNMSKPIGVLSRRSFAVANKVARGRAAQLLSTPTHTGGWIDPLILAGRINNWQGEDPDITDVVLSILRLAPENRSEALGTLKESDAEWANAIHYALGGDVPIGKTAALWITAARVRTPWQQDDNLKKVFSQYGADAAKPASYSLEFKKGRNWVTLTIHTEQNKAEADPDCIPLTLHSERGNYMWELGGIGGRTETSVCWSSTVWPGARDSFFAAAAVNISKNIDWWEANWQNKAFFESLLDPGTPLRKMGMLLLILGLAAKEPGEYGLATDAAITAIEDGRLGSDNFGEMLIQILPTGLIKPGRLYKTLKDISGVSAVHSAVVKLSLEQCLTGNIKEMPRDFGKLLELLNELCIDLQHGVGSDEHRAFLKQITGTSKAAKAAKAILKVEVTSESLVMKNVFIEAINQRVSALKKWQ